MHTFSLLIIRPAAKLQLQALVNRGEESKYTRTHTHTHTPRYTQTHTHAHTSLAPVKLALGAQLRQCSSQMMRVA